ncbi:MAG: hypothetical protein M1391_14635 [Bacteroidetes bacterium]|nr:hypothetical protein [Bacteroidota bacterium]
MYAIVFLFMLTSSFIFLGCDAVMRGISPLPAFACSIIFFILMCYRGIKMWKANHTITGD